MNAPMLTPQRSHRFPLLIMLAAACTVLCGCGILPWVAHGVAGGKGPQTYDVKAQYRGLENKSVAVLVAANEMLLFEYPAAPLKVSRTISARIAGNVPGVRLMPPGEVAEFQNENPYWSTVPYSELIKKLGVDRLVVIDLIEYRTHEPGNAYVWHGLIAGQIGVVEAEADDPDQFAFQTTVRAAYPEESTIGLLNSDDETVELGMLALFARDGAGLFYDHEVVKD